MLATRLCTEHGYIGRTTLAVKETPRVLDNSIRLMSRKYLIAPHIWSTFKMLLEGVQMKAIEPINFRSPY